MPSFRFTSGERHVFRRRAHISLSVWASQNIVVKDGLCGRALQAGRESVPSWNHGYMEHSRRERSRCLRQCQTGKTLVMHAALAYCVDMRPGPRMLAMQDDDAISKVVANN